jgi:AraC-like DNA-binding protein
MAGLRRNRCEVLIVEPMRPTANRQQVIAALNTWLAVPPDLPVRRVLAGQRPAHEQPAYFMEVPRLIVGLVGRGSFLTDEHDREVVFDLEAGQVMFLAPFTWICPVPRTPYRSLGVVLRPDSTRLTIYSRQGIARDGTVSGRYLAQWRTLETLGAKGEHLLELLRAAPNPRLGERNFRLLAEMLLAELADLVARAPEHDRTSHTVVWQSVCDYLSEHWSDPQLSRKGTAAFFQRHPNHFSRLFHVHAKCNFRAYVNGIRLERSVHFLRDLRYNVTDVACLCGFTDLQYFIRCFRQRFGFTPGEYRKRSED